MKQYNHTAIRNVHPTAIIVKYSYENEAHIVYDKDGNLIDIDESKVQTEHNRLEAEYDTQAYSRNRKAEYPPMEDQLDYMYHNGFEKWKTDMIDPVKDKYPKG